MGEQINGSPGDSAIGCVGKCILVPATLVITGSSEAPYCCEPILHSREGEGTYM